MKEFQGKVAVVTSAAGGIGRGLAEKCAQEGMQVVLADIEEKALMIAWLVEAQCLLETEKNMKGRIGHFSQGSNTSPGERPEKGISSMSTEDNKALARRGFEETLNQRNLTVLDELHVPDFVYHAASRTIQGREPFKQFISMLLTAFPDLHVSIEDVIGEGDKVVVRFTGRGTHQGELMGISPRANR